MVANQERGWPAIELILDRLPLTAAVLSGRGYDRFFVLESGTRRTKLSSSAVRHRSYLDYLKFSSYKPAV